MRGFYLFSHWVWSIWLEWIILKVYVLKKKFYIFCLYRFRIIYPQVSLYVAQRGARLGIFIRSLAPRGVWARCMYPHDPKFTFEIGTGTFMLTRLLIQHSKSSSHFQINKVKSIFVAFKRYLVTPFLFFLKHSTKEKVDYNSKCLHRFL